MVKEVYFASVPDQYPPEQALGITNFGELFCYEDCPNTGHSSISQQINQLIVNEQYQLSFYVFAQSYGLVDPVYVDGKITGGTDQYIVPPPLLVSFGGQDSGPLALPLNDNTGNVGPLKLTLNFTATSTSEALTFIQSFSTLTGCVPCGNSDWIKLTNITLMDIGEGPPPPPPPPPNVTEPSTLGILGLGLGLLGLLYRRRRNGTDA